MNHQMVEKDKFKFVRYSNESTPFLKSGVWTESKCISTIFTYVFEIIRMPFATININVTHTPFTHLTLIFYLFLEN